MIHLLFMCLTRQFQKFLILVLETNSNDPHELREIEVISKVAASGFEIDLCEDHLR